MTTSGNTQIEWYVEERNVQIGPTAGGRKSNVYRSNDGRFRVIQRYSPGIKGRERAGYHWVLVDLWVQDKSRRSSFDPGKSACELTEGFGKMRDAKTSAQEKVELEARWEEQGNPRTNWMPGARDLVVR